MGGVGVQLCVTYAQTLGKHVLPTEVVLCSGKCRVRGGAQAIHQHNL